MSQPPVSGPPPEPRPPSSYGGYGAELQRYQAQNYPQAPGYPPPVYPAPGMPAPWAAQQQLPHPGMPQDRPWPQPPQRPAVIALAATLAVTASLQFLGALTLAWLISLAGRQLSTTGGEGALYHILNRFNDRMLNGLAWPLFGFPLAALVLGFLLPNRRPWVRLAFTVLGAAALLWMGWLFHSNLVWWLVPGIYVASTVGILWTSAASHWYRWQPA